MADSTQRDEPEGIPPGRELELPGRGTTFIRELSGPPGAPTLMLMHGFAATGGINWLTCFERLHPHFNIVTIDHRGHGRGLRSPARFRIEDCAEDVAVLMDQLGIRSAIFGGYSMGGPISQLVWRHHRSLVKGLILSATCYRFFHGSSARMFVTSATGALAQLTRVAEIAAAIPLSGLQLLFPTPVQTSGSLGRWGADEVRRHSIRSMLEASMALGAYNAESWVGEIDVPTAVVLTTLDRAVPPIWQLRQARIIPGATVHPLAEGHMACGHPLFGMVFAEAAVEVAERVAAREAAGAGGRMQNAALG